MNAKTETPCFRCGRVSETGNWDMECGHALCDTDFLDLKTSGTCPHLRPGEEPELCFECGRVAPVPCPYCCAAESPAAVTRGED
jgi:hypothetical protein